MRRLAAGALAVGAMTAVSVALAAPSANADLVTYCVGSGGAVTVPNDLYVPPGESCSLDGTTVTGNVRIAAGANLMVTGGRFNREVQIAADGFLDATNTKVDGQIVLAPGGFGVFLKDTEIGSVNVQPKGAATREGFLFLDHAMVNGTVTSAVGDVRLENGSEVGTDINTDGTFYTDLRDSFVDGALNIRNNSAGSVICGSAVQGVSSFTGNAGVQLGPNGSLASCASGGYFARDVTIANTSQETRVDDNIINGKLTLTANNPTAVVAPNNRIRGGITGDHQTAGAEAAARSATVDRRADLDQRLQARRAAAQGL